MLPFLKNYFDASGAVDTFKKGQLWFRSFMKLEIASAEVVGRAKTDVQFCRSDRFASSGPKVASLTPEVKEAIFSGDYQPRKQTKVASKATVYGKRSRVTTSLVYHNFSGINRAYVTDEGVPNETAVFKRLRELAANNDLKEQRLHYFFDNVITNDYYDNATPLLYIMLMKYHQLKIASRMHTRRHVIKMTAPELEAICASDEPDIMYDNLRNFILTHPTDAAGVARKDIHLKSMLPGLMTKRAMIPTKEVPDAGGNLVENIAYTNYRHELAMMVWEMYEYNDGHSSSGPSFGDDLDFRMNRYKVPEWMDRFIEPESHRFANLDGEWPLNENSMTEYGKAYGYINASGLSGKEVYLTQHFLEGHVRETPLLVDQDVNLDLGGRKIYFTFCPRTDCQEITQYTSKEVAALIVKLVKTHGWYEDLFDAVKAMKYWLAQPGTETVESHWWLSLNRNLTLPKLGLRRAAMSLFLEGDGVHVSQDAINVFNTIRSMDDTPIMESAFLNSVWYWGEFLNRSVGKDLMATMKKLHFRDDDTLYEYTRADAIVSAMLGCAVPKTRATNVSTWITGGLESQIRNRVKFGRINIESKEDYGYEQQGSDLIANGISAPGGMGLVVGLAGSLIAGTPYGSMFGINQAVTKGTIFKSVEAYNYNDLWAYGVVNRWQGYDTYYRHPNSDHDHRMYAANDVGVAMPPVTPKTLKSYESYQLRRIVEREHSFGTSLENARTAKMTFIWKRNSVCALSEPVFTAMPTLPSLITYAEVKRMTSTLVDVKYASAHIMAQYDYVMADFIVAETTTAALVPAPRDQLELDTGEDPLPEPGESPGQEEPPA